MRSSESPHKKRTSEERPIIIEGKLTGTREEIFEDWQDRRLPVEEIWKNKEGDTFSRVVYERDGDGKVLREIWINGPAENPDSEQREGTREYIYDADGNLKDKIFTPTPTL
jgi:hypothetical protein